MPDLFVAQKQTQNKEESARLGLARQAAPETLESDPNENTFVEIEGKTPHLLSSYCENPNGVNFAEAEPDEKILLFLRKHFITNIPWILITVLLLLAPLLIIFAVNYFQMDISFLPNHSVLFLFLFYYLLVFSYVLVEFFTWFFNISLITQKRVIDIDFSDLVYKNVAATKLDLVQDASFSQIGVIRNIFDYGDVLIQTAGTLDNFDFFAVPRPEKVIQIVENLIGKG